MNLVKLRDLISAVSNTSFRCGYCNIETDDGEKEYDRLLELAHKADDELLNYIKVIFAEKTV